MERYIGLGIYEKGDVGRILESGIYSGILLGDPLCSRRMFEYGDMGLIRAAELVRDWNQAHAWPGGPVRSAQGQGRGKFRILLQAPLYLTDGALAHFLTQAEFLRQECGLGGILLNDVGAALTLGTRLPDVPLVWGQDGLGRGHVLNHWYVEHLKSIGVSGMLVSRRELMEVLPDFGIEPWPVYGSRGYLSVCRECYSCYGAGIYSGDCGRACRKSRQTLRSGAFHCSVDGHLLNETIRYEKGGRGLQASKGSPVLFQAKSYEAMKDHEEDFLVWSGVQGTV